MAKIWLQKKPAMNWAVRSRRDAYWIKRNRDNSAVYRLKFLIRKPSWRTEQQSAKISFLVVNVPWNMLALRVIGRLYVWTGEGMAGWLMELVILLLCIVQR